MTVKMLSSVLLLSCLTSLQAIKTNNIRCNDDIKQQSSAPSADINSEGLVDIVITMAQKIDASGFVNSNEFSSRGERISAIKSHLRDGAAASQSALISEFTTPDSNGRRRLLEHQKVETFWLSNKVYMSGTTKDQRDTIAARIDVASVNAEQSFQIEKPLFISNDTEMLNQVSSSSIQWGVSRVGAPELWDEGLDGEGIIVANIDTGVRYTHEILRDNFVKSHGWFDPYDATTTPNDDDGHGTHTMGTIVGKRGYGVAPGASWMACKGCNDEGCSERALLKCAEFLACPTAPDGSDEDCSKAPHVINNSWSGGQGNFWFQDAIKAWHDMGIIPIFSAGNTGDGCSTVNSPGDYDNVISVGSTTDDDALSSFSSRGPSIDGKLIKPDISAPGSDVRSAYKSSDRTYATYSGTSMASPHVAGIVALMMQVNPELSYIAVLDLIRSNAITDVLNMQSESNTCSSDKNSFPNNLFGHGLISPETVRSVAEPRGSSGGSSPVPAPPVQSQTPPPSGGPVPAPPVQSETKSCNWKILRGCSDGCKFSWTKWRCYPKN